MRIHIIYQRKPGGKTKTVLLPSREEIRRFVRNHKLGINDYALYAGKKLIKNFKDTEYNIKEGKKMGKTIKDDIMDNYRFLNNEPVNEAKIVELDPRDIKELKRETRELLRKFEAAFLRAYGENEPGDRLLRAVSRRKLSEYLKEVSDTEDLRGA